MLFWLFFSSLLGTIEIGFFIFYLFIFYPLICFYFFIFYFFFWHDSKWSSFIIVITKSRFCFVVVLWLHAETVWQTCVRVLTSVCIMYYQSRFFSPLNVTDVNANNKKYLYALDIQYVCGFYRNYIKVVTCLIYNLYREREVYFRFCALLIFPDCFAIVYKKSTVIWAVKYFLRYPLNE